MRIRGRGSRRQAQRRQHGSDLVGRLVELGRRVGVGCDSAAHPHVNVGPHVMPDVPKGHSPAPVPGGTDRRTLPPTHRRLTGRLHGRLGREGWRLGPRGQRRYDDEPRRPHRRGRNRPHNDRRFADGRPRCRETLVRRPPPRPAGAIIARTDVHAGYPPDYLRSCVEALRRCGVWCVGGVLSTRPGAETPVARAIAIIQSHRFGVGVLRGGHEGPDLVSVDRLAPGTGV